MDNNQIHFLDSNIFLSIALEDCSKNICEDYFKTNFTKYASDNVETETKKVIRNHRVISFGILQYIKDYADSNNLSDAELPKYINTIKKNFLKDYSNDEFPFGFTQKKFVQIVNQNFNDYSELFARYGSFISAVDILDNKHNDILVAFFISSNILFNLFNNVTILTFKTHLSDESLSEKLEKIGIHNPDDKILIDSFKTAKNLKRFVNFITRDNGILENSKDISNIFDSKVFVFAPEHYINN